MPVTANWTSFSKITPTGTPNPISDGQPILASQIAALFARVDLYLDWFKGDNDENFPFPGTLKFTPPTYGAAFRLLSTGSNPGTLSEGDVWRVGEEIRVRVNGTTTKTLAFTDSSFSAFTVAGNGAVGGTFSVASTTTLNGVTTVAATADPAFVVRKASDGAIAFQVNTTANSVEVRNGNWFSVFNSANNLAVFTVTDAGAVSLAGALTLSSSSNITTETGTVTAGILRTSTTAANGQLRLSTTDGIQRYNTSLSPAAYEGYGTPQQVHTAGITFNVGNGVDTITTGVQSVSVIIPYACTIESWTISQPLDSTTGSIAVSIERRTSGSATFSPLTGLSSTAVVLSSASYSSGTITPVALAQGDVLRVKVASGVTLKTAAIHLRLRRTV